MLSPQSASIAAYQDATASGATKSGLLQLVYLHVAQDLLRAGEAVRDSNIQARCAASNHALALLGHLESWIQDMEEPELQCSLAAFYCFLREAIVRAQTTPDAVTFDELAQLVMSTRTAWQTKENSLRPSMCTSLEVSLSCSEAISFHV